MVLIINVLLLVMGSTGALAAFGGETWVKNGKPLVKRITARGWISLFCLVCALFLGITKEVVTSREKEIAAKESQKAKAALQNDLDKANEKLLITQTRLETLKDVIDRIPKEIDHPLYNKNRHGNEIYSSETGRPLDLFAGEMLKYQIFEIDDSYDMRLNSIAFNIGNMRYLLHTNPGTVTVAGDRGIPMQVFLENPNDVSLTIKMTVLSTVRDSIKSNYRGIQ